MIRCVAILLAAVAGLAIVDNVRPWKRLQVEFFELERQQLRSRLGAARANAGEALTELEAQIESEEARLLDRRDEIEQLEDDLKRFRGKSRAAELRRQRLVRAADAELDELRQARIEIESLGELITDRESKLAAVRSDLDQMREDLARAQAPIEALEQRLAASPASPILPFGGLWAPGVGVREVSLPASSIPSTGAAAARVDRCITCHLAAARDDLEDDDWPAPFRRHPQAKMFVDAASPHPVDRFGCTSCHGGDGRATDFSRAGHVPRTTEQALEWKTSWNWRPPSRGAMLPLDLTEAACARCHGSQATRQEAAVTAHRLPTLDRGRRLIAALGCTGCHASDHRALASASKAGPSLVGIAGKTSAAWVHRWLEEPRAFRRPTRMPHVFEAGESQTPEQRVEMRAIVDHLWQASRPPQYGSSPAGEVETGRTLFETVGCSGCHRLDLETDTAPMEQSHGPHLAGTGSKVDAGWLFAWLRDPNAYRHDTPMPNLRLDEREAADLTVYLMTRRDPAWERLTLPAIDSEIRDRLILSALAQSHTLEQSQARFDRMSEREKNLYLGEQAITRYGCHGCHEIAGFEQTPAIGSSLHELSYRLQDQLASATEGPWSESAHRPAYDLSDDERRAVIVALLGLASEHGSTSAETEATRILTEGRRIVEHYNCRGCHRIEGRGGATAPDLIYTGARLKTSWLYEYLADPRRENRPWLKVRMPTFGLSESENNALVRYFAMLDDRPLFADEPPSPGPATDVTVGRVVFHLLQCGDCHQPESDESASPQTAPSYRQASERLRPDWVTAVILDPEYWLPGTSMPANFRPDGGEEESSDFLIGSIHTPIFAAERDRLLRLLGSEERLHAYLSDPQRVAAALRDYLWTLGK